MAVASFMAGDIGAADSFCMEYVPKRTIRIWLGVLLLILLLFFSGYKVVTLAMLVLLSDRFGTYQDDCGFWLGIIRNKRKVSA